MGLKSAKEWVDKPKETSCTFAILRFLEASVLSICLRRVGYAYHMPQIWLTNNKWFLDGEQYDNKAYKLKTGSRLDFMLCFLSTETLGQRISPNRKHGLQGRNQ